MFFLEISIWCKHSLHTEFATSRKYFVIIKFKTNKNTIIILLLFANRIVAFVKSNRIHIKKYIHVIKKAFANKYFSAGCYCVKTVFKGNCCTDVVANCCPGKENACQQKCSLADELERQRKVASENSSLNASFGSAISVFVPKTNDPLAIDVKLCSSSEQMVKCCYLFCQG